ncbi:MAG: gamma carbonic anhydrase family protein, partial [Planctomycetota bacterium]
AALTVGDETNIQDLVMVHPDPDAPMVIGSQVTVGHSAVLHGIRIDDRVLIGIGAILLSGSTIGEGAIVAAGAVVRENWHVPPNTLVAGVPARIMRDLTEDEVSLATWRAEKYWKTAQDRWNASQR